MVCTGSFATDTVAVAVQVVAVSGVTGTNGAAPAARAASQFWQ